MTQNTKKQAMAELSTIPNISKVSAGQLWEVGIHSQEDLKVSDPEKVYADLLELPMTNIDRIMLYVLRCAHYYLNTQEPEAEKLKWWYWKDVDE